MVAFAEVAAKTGNTRVVRADAAFGSTGTSWAVLSQVVRQVVPWLAAGAPGMLGAAVPFELALGHRGRSGDGAHGGGHAGWRRGWGVGRRCTRCGCARGLEEDEPGAEPVTLREVGLVLRRMLAETATSGPVVVLVDAMESADRQSRMVLAELCRRPPVGAGAGGAGRARRRPAGP